MEIEQHSANSSAIQCDQEGQKQTGFTVLQDAAQVFFRIALLKMIVFIENEFNLRVVRMLGKSKQPCGMCLHVA